MQLKKLVNQEQTKLAGEKIIKIGAETKFRKKYEISMREKLHFFQKLKPTNL